MSAPVEPAGSHAAPFQSDGTLLAQYSCVECDLRARFVRGTAHLFCLTVFRFSLRRPHHKEAEVLAIQGIIQKYKISNADVEALLKWRHSWEH